MLFGNLCLHSLIPCQHQHHSYYNKYLPKAALSSFATSLSVFTAVQATSLSLSLSVSLIPAFLRPIIFAANSALSNTLRFSRLPHPLNHLFTVPVFFTPYMSTAGINRQLSCSCCPPALYPSLFSSLLNPSFQPFFSLTSAVILGFPPLTCVTTTVHFLL